MFSLTLVKKIKVVFNNAAEYAKNENFPAAISETEKLAALVAQYSKTRANEVYSLIDKTWDVVCHVENRVPSQYTKFKNELATLYALIITDYLCENDSTFNSIFSDFASIKEYARKNSSYAFTIAERLSKTFKIYSYKHGSDYKYYFSGYDEDSNGCKRLVELTKTYTQDVVKIAVKAFIAKI